MENFPGNYSKATKIKVPPGMKTQKLIIGSSRYHSNSLSPARFDSENVDLNEPILSYLCGGSPVAGKLAPRGSRSPLSAVDNLIERSPPPREVYRTPVKAVEGEEVLVMDGVPLKRSTRFSGSKSSGSSGKSLFKAEIFQSPEDSEKCRHSPKCQFARGKEDDHPTRLSIKNKTEQLSRSHDNSPGLRTNNPNSIFLPQVVTPTSSEVTMSPDRRFNHPIAGQSIRISSSTTPFIAPQRASPATFQMSALAAPFIPGQTPAAAIPETHPISQMSTSTAPYIPSQTSEPATSVTSIPRTMSANAAPFIPHQRASPAMRVTQTPVQIAKNGRSVLTLIRQAPSTTASTNTKSTLPNGLIWSEWSPQDDGIEVTLPFSAPDTPPSVECVNDYIDKVLSEGLKTRRLPVFSEICPDK